MRLRLHFALVPQGKNFGLDKKILTSKIRAGRK